MDNRWLVETRMIAIFNACIAPVYWTAAFVFVTRTASWLP
jgi:hypothetical protein